MTNTPMTSREAFALYCVEQKSKGYWVVIEDDFIAGYEASQAQQASEVEALKHDIESYIKITSEQTQTIAELVEALEMWAGLINYQYTGSKEAMSALQICDDFGQEVLAKVKGNND